MKYIYIFLIIILSVSSLFSQKYEIKIKVKGISSGNVYLGNYYRENQYVIDTVEINKKGVAVFSGNKKLDGGVYLIMFPDRDMGYFELLISDDQEFTIETDTLQFYQKNILAKGSVANTEFFVFNKQLREFGEKLYYLQANAKKHSANKDSIQSIRKRIDELVKQREEYIETSVNKSENNTFKAVVNLMREAKIPEFNISETVTNKDSLKRIKQFKFYKNHYWDFVDFSDSTVLRTKIFEPKLKRYLTKLIMQNPDTILKEANVLIEKTKGNNQMYRFMVEYMLGFTDMSKLMGMDKVFVETAKQYHLKGLATWADSSRLSKIKSSVEKLEPNLVGKKAPNLQRLESIDYKYYTLYDIKSEYTIIAFWEPHCGHCKKEIPKLYKVYESLKLKGISVQVMSVYTQVDRKPWEEFIEEKEMTDWLNVYDKYQNTNFRKLYNIYATPSIYLLDKNKKIIGKKLGADQVEKFILNIDRMKKGEKPIH